MREVSGGGNDKVAEISLAMTRFYFSKSRKFVRISTIATYITHKLWPAKFSIYWRETM